MRLGELQETQICFGYYFCCALLSNRIQGGNKAVIIEATTMIMFEIRVFLVLKYELTTAFIHCVSYCCLALERPAWCEKRHILPLCIMGPVRQVIVTKLQFRISYLSISIFCRFFYFTLLFFSSAFIV